MNTKQSKLLPFLRNLPLFLHLALVFGAVFYLTPEISLYPYLVSNGLTPYLNLIDQHFPLIFFGPLNLGQLGITTPQSSLNLFVTLIFLTDLGALLLLARSKLSYLKQTLVLFAFVLSQILLGGRTLWLETFLLLFLVWAFFFLTKPGKKYQFVAGILLGTLVATRITLAPFLLVLLLIQPKKRWLPLLLGFTVIPALELIWLLNNQLLSTFITQLSFNTEYYFPLGKQLPSLRQLLISIIAISPIFLLKKHFQVLIFLALLLALGAYPRFELVHLLPLTALLFLGNWYPRRVPLLLPWVVIIFIFIVLRTSWSSTNFFNPPSLVNTAQELKDQINSLHIYFFGGPDTLYQLTNTTPPGDYYLPSLPWYLANPQYVSQQISALKKNPTVPVVVNTESSLNSINISIYGQAVYQHIKENYIHTSTINSLQIYTLKP